MKNIFITMVIILIFALGFIQNNQTHQPIYHGTNTPTTNTLFQPPTTLPTTQFKTSTPFQITNPPQSPPKHPPKSPSINKPKTMEDCLKLSNEPSKLFGNSFSSPRDICISALAREQNNPTLCDSSTSLQTKESCMVSIAAINEEFSICPKLVTEEKNTCWFLYALTTNDSSICANIEPDSELKSLCSNI